MASLRPKESGSMGCSGAKGRTSSQCTKESTVCRKDIPHAQVQNPPCPGASALLRLEADQPIGKGSISVATNL